VGNKFSERLYSTDTLAKIQNSIQEEIKSRLKSGNAGYH
jgi:hypothetical protein